MKERIHLSKADVGELEEEYVIRALRSGWVAPLGPDVDAFESETANRVGVQHAVALSSGTAALHLALIELGARPGTVVIVPTMTFAATANAILYTGAEPVFVDCNPHDGNISPELLSQALATETAKGRQIAAVITVDLFGRMCDYERIVPLVHSYGIPLVEDAAEALGSANNGLQAGAVGDVSALSFNGNKITTTSGGGMLLTDNHHLAQRARKLSTQARENTPWYEHTEVGYNYRLSNILAALGRAQLARLDSMIQSRRRIRSRYQEGLPHSLSLLTPLHESLNDNCWLTCVRIPEPNATSLVSYLNHNGIEARHVWNPLHRQIHMRQYARYVDGASESLFDHCIALPSGSGLTTEDQEIVLTRLSYFFDHKPLSHR